MAKEILNEAGINTTLFKANSTRAASTKDIMKMADWSRESTFEMYYHKPLVDDVDIKVRL